MEGRGTGLLLNPPVPISTAEWREALRVVLPKNTMQCPQSGSQTWTAGSGDKCTNHEVTASPNHMSLFVCVTM